MVGGQCPLQAEICAQTDAPLRKTSYTSTHKITVLGHVSQNLSAIAELLVLSLSVSVHLFVFSVCLCINGIMQKALKLLQEKPIKFWCLSYSKWLNGSDFGFPLNTMYITYFHRYLLRDAFIVGFGSDIPSI